MEDICWRFMIQWDANFDGVISISDVWLWVKYIWLIPAKLTMLIIDHSPAIKQFFEMNCETGTGTGIGAAFFSFWVWLILFAGIANEIKRSQIAQ